MVRATVFDIYPAIDLRGGRVVRLVEGDFARETAYSDDPSAVAGSFADQGATWMHVVDLDAARTGEEAETAAIESIVAAVRGRVRVQVAGGIRTEERAAARLALGAARVVLGTAALRDPVFARRVIDRHGSERVAAAIDVRDGLALGHGWAPDASGVDAVTAVRTLADAGVATFAVTSIARDGRLEGPDLALLEAIVGLHAGAVVASGGVASEDDLRRVREVGCAGAIVGRALYEGRLSLAGALAVASERG